MEKQTFLNKDRGFTLLEVLISIIILSIIVTSATSAFVYASRVSGDNKLKLTAVNLANETVEYIRSLEFAQVGTKILVGGVTIYGDPAGDILQTRTENISGVQYTVNTTISWEEQGGWDLGDTDWDYKSVKVAAFPTGKEGDADMTKVIETYITRDSTQPALTGANISLRIIRGWNTVPGTKIPVINAKVKLTAGPSAPRQVQTSSAGVARFIDLAAGNYTVLLDPGNLGMILHPDQAGAWNINVSSGLTQTKEFEAEYPCSIRITLKDLDGNPLILNPSVTGAIKIEVPYGAEINKNFNSMDIDSAGTLPQNFITGLWPVGDGYTGAYTIADVSIDQCQYLGCYAMDTAGEVVWSGKFDAPATCKSVTCYFGTIPLTPSGINTEWTGTGAEIVTATDSYTSYDDEEINIISGKFDTGDPADTIIMPENKSTDFNAHIIYFENSGTGGNPGLYLKSGSDLTLHTGTVVFRGVVEIQATGYPADPGTITLCTAYEDGTSAPAVDGSLIGGTAGVSYGKVYLAEPVIMDGANLVEPGGYYYYDGLVLPDNASDLIPITKENYNK